MMPRARISKNGVFVAKEGFDVDTSEEKDLLFSNNSIVGRLRESGTTDIGAFTRVSHGNYNFDSYRKTFNFANVYSRPPIVFVATKFVLGGKVYSERLIHANFLTHVHNGSAYHSFIPSQWLVVTTTQLTIDTKRVPAQAALHYYFVWEPELP